MILFPNAKINIGLNIVNRRPDGYHDLETIFYPVPWRDILEIVPAKGSVTTLTVSGRPVDCPADKNLVMKAVKALDEITPLPPVDIYLEKIIPDGAGLGGGSADAAFTLAGLNELFELNFDKSRLAAIASRIGADCPFFIYDTPLFASGIGDQFSPVEIDLSEYVIAIVKPPVSVSTKEAYSGVTPGRPAQPLRRLVAEPVDKWRDQVVNDFEKSIFLSHPEIAEVKNALLEMGARYASMSGSGAAVYALFDCDSDILSESIRNRFRDCDTLVSHL